jgi:hypothetical protein
MIPGESTYPVGQELLEIAVGKNSVGKNCHPEASRQGYPKDRNVMAKQKVNKPQGTVKRANLQKQNSGPT